MNYLEIIKNVVKNGKSKQPTRLDINGDIIKVENPTIGTFCEVFRHDMSQGFPLTTLRKMPWRSIRVELEGFIKGITDKSWYQQRGCKFWDEWANPTDKPILLNREAEKEWFYHNKDLGPLGYCAGWRNFGGSYKPIPCINTEFSKHIEIINEKDELCGKCFDGKYGKYTVMSYDEKDVYENKRFTVKFNVSGYVKNNLCKKQITDCNVFDPYYPNIANVACVGEYKKVTINNVYNEEDKEKIVESLKNQWRQMIQRCFNPKNKYYNNYGGKNIYVSNRWLVFANFLEDVQQISGWEKKLENWKEYQLDKDFLGKGYYSKDSCLWITRKDNINYTNQQFLFDATDPEGKTYINQVGLKKFCEKNNLSVKTVEASIYNNNNTHNGWKFIRKNNISTNVFINGFDQLGFIIDKLKSSPSDRRMVCSAWNPNQMHLMALPPCHWSFNVVVYENKINLVWHQRSADLLLGVGSNIASYGLLLTLLAEESGLQPGELVGTLADCHIYDNLLDNAKEILKREEKDLPTLKIKRKSDGSFSIFDWNWNDVELIGYDPHPAIKMGDVTV